MRTPTRTDRRTGSIGRLLLPAAMAVVVVACSGSAASTANGQRGAAGAGAAAEPAAMPAASAAPAGVAADGGGSGQDVAVVDDTKIVRTGSLEMTVADTDRAVLTGRDAIRGLGGYIGASQQQRTDGKIVATVTYRIPVARWEDALDAIRKLGTEVSEQSQATEVTGQLVDLDARIRNLKASETALVGYAAKAPKVSDLLEIEARLTETRGEIEQLSAQQAMLADQAAMATLTVTFGTEIEAVTEAATRWDPAAEVDRASATLLGIGQSLVSFFIVFAIVWLPILLVVAVLVLVGLTIVRRLGWRRRDGFPPIGPTGRPGGPGTMVAASPAAGPPAEA